MDTDVCSMQYAVFRIPHAVSGSPAYSYVLSKLKSRAGALAIDMFVKLSTHCQAFLTRRHCSCVLLHGPIGHVALQHYYCRFALVVALVVA